MPFIYTTNKIYPYTAKIYPFTAKMYLYMFAATVCGNQSKTLVHTTKHLINSRQRLLQKLHEKLLIVSGGSKKKINSSIAFVSKWNHTDL